VDGSPQGLTAYLSKPFLIPAFGENNAGFEIYAQAKLNEVVSFYHKLGYQLAMHGNGDAAIEQIIAAVETAQKVAPREDPRHLLVHAQLLRADQLQRQPTPFSGATGTENRLARSVRPESAPRRQLKKMVYDFLFTPIPLLRP